jgi:hypothetical protein
MGFILLAQEGPALALGVMLILLLKAYCLHMLKVLTYARPFQMNALSTSMNVFKEFLFLTRLVLPFQMPFTIQHVKKDLCTMYQKTHIGVLTKWVI